MKKIVYIGNKPIKADNVAATGITWTRGQTHEVQDDKKAEKLLEYPTVWQDADQPYDLQPEVALAKEPKKPAVSFIPQGGSEVFHNWEPITVFVDADVFKRLSAKELIAIFMTTEDADAYEVHKKKRDEAVRNMANARAARKAKAGQKAACGDPWRRCRPSWTWQGSISTIVPRFAIPMSIC